MKSKNSIVPQSKIENRIFVIRGHKVMTSIHLAEPYGVETRALNQPVKRNILRFPSDFMFQISEQEPDLLVSQNVIPHRKLYGGSLPFALTLQGMAMLSTVLRGGRAMQMNIAIMRALVKLREILSTHKEIASKLNQLETKVEKHDEEFQSIFEAIQQLMAPPEKPKRQIGF